MSLTEHILNSATHHIYVHVCVCVCVCVNVEREKERSSLSLSLSLFSLSLSLSPLSLDIFTQIHHYSLFYLFLKMSLVILRSQAARPTHKINKTFQKMGGHFFFYLRNVHFYFQTFCVYSPTTWWWRTFITSTLLLVLRLSSHFL